MKRSKRIQTAFEASKEITDSEANDALSSLLSIGINELLTLGYMVTILPKDRLSKINLEAVETLSALRDKLRRSRAN